MAGNIGEASSTFAIKIFSDLNVNSGNILFAPWSMFNALAMTFAGAQGNTAHQMSNILGLANPDSFPDMLRILTQLQGLKSVKSANKIWMQKNFNILSEFLQCLKTYFLTETGEADFVNNCEGARKEINSWVEKKTNSKIKNLIPPGVIDAMTRLVLVSAVYFKEAWLTEFPKENTRPMTFYVSGGNSINVQMMFMNGKKNVMYDKGENFQVLSLPYIGKRLSMNIILPKKGISLDQILNDLKSRESVMSAFTNPSTHPENIEIYIPKFKFDYTQEYNEILQKHGCADMFDDVLADFSGISNEKPGLKVSTVIQKAFIEVNEEGTEAAAASAVVLLLKCAKRPKMEPPIVFKADRPFIFIIFEKKANIILFIGKVVNPSI